jgi:hypothetical protein
LTQELYYRELRWTEPYLSSIRGVTTPLCTAELTTFDKVLREFPVWRGSYYRRFGAAAATADRAGMGGIPRSDSSQSAGDASNPWGWYLCERPWKTFRMGSAILAKGGNELGVTFYGHCNFQWSDNTTTKTHEGHFTFYSRPVVRNVKQYAIAEDIFVIGYVSGEVSGHEGKHFVSHDKIRNGEWSGHQIGDLYDGSLGSILAYHISGDGNGNLDDVRMSISNPHSISGQWGAGLQKSYESSSTSSDYHFPCAAYVNNTISDFFDSLAGEMYRVVNGPFSSVGTHNMVTWESGYYSMVDGSKYVSSAGGTTGTTGQRIYVEPSCALPGLFPHGLAP